MDIDDDLAVRAHIRKLLLQYAIKHLTIDYVEYTLAEVTQVGVVLILSGYSISNAPPS
jgi:hypothetical protein